MEKKAGSAIAGIEGMAIMDIMVIAAMNTVVVVESAVSVAEAETGIAGRVVVTVAAAAAAAGVKRGL